MDDTAVVEPLRFRRVPMMAAALCFATGDVLALHWQATFFLVAAAGLSLLLAWFSIRRGDRVAIVPVLAFWMVVGCWCAQIQPPIATQQSLTQYADGLSRIVRGRVERIRPLKALSAEDGAPQQPWMMEPGAWETDHDAATESVDLDVQAVEEVTPDVSTMRDIGGGVRVTVDGSAARLDCGDIVEVPLRLRVPDVYRDPGAWSQATYFLNEGIGAQASVKAEKLHVIGRVRSSWKCRLQAAQMWATERMDAFVASGANHALPQKMQLNAEDAAMLNAMLFGDRAGLTKTLRVGFERTGTFHLFVVSGLHVALLAGALFWLLRKMHMPEGFAVSATILLAMGFALLTGFGAPVQRALYMTAAYLLARWLARESGALNALGIAALVVLALDPRALFEASVQMTFLVIVAIAGIASPINERLLGAYKNAAWELWVVRRDAHVHPRVAQLRMQMRMFGTVLAALFGQPIRNAPLWFLRTTIWIIEAIVFGCVMEMCMVLPMAMYFHRATLLALPTNMIAIPMMIVLLGAAVVMFCMSLVSSWLAMLPAAVVSMMLHTIRGIVAHIGHAAIADLRVPAPSIAAIAVACVAIVFCCWQIRRRKQWLVGLVALCFVPLVVLWPVGAVGRPGVLEVTALDVGQGDSLLVVSPEGKTLLVDAGGPVGQVLTADRWDVGEEVVAPYLWSRRIARLDAVLLTHAHSDHMGGMPAVLRDMRPRELWVSVVPGNAPGLQALLAEARELGVTVRWFRAGDAFAWGGLQADVLAPEVGYANPGVAVNNDSLVMRLAFGKASVLLEGDAEAPSEREMVSHGLVEPVTLLKVGHHGSMTSTTPEFLAAAAPREAVISVGRRNTFGHPRFEVLERLEQAGVKTFRTDREGAETFVLSREGGISAVAATSK